MLLLVVACSETTVDSSSTTAPSSTTSSTTTIPSDDICRIGDLLFGDDGLVAALGVDVGDAAVLSNIRWESAATCERLTVAFATESGAPASSLGPTGVSVLAASGIVRIALPRELTRTAVADLLPDGTLSERVFVVRDDDGALSIDIHTSVGQSVAARAFVTTSPSTLVIDLIDAGAPTPPIGAQISPVAVATTPIPGGAEYPFVIRGYAAPGLSGLTLQLTTDGQLWTDRTVSLKGWTDAWQRYTTEVTEGPSGTASIFVGSLGPEGQPDEGVAIVVDLP
jgi:hypothetical protein